MADPQPPSHPCHGMPCAFSSLPWAALPLLTPAMGCPAPSHPCHFSALHVFSLLTCASASPAATPLR
eukprot:2758335-Pleurochrysis_carterae.AAC.1